MKEEDIYSELTSIRSLMERSSKFISLSGISGVMAGIYALVGAFLGYKIIYQENDGLTPDYHLNDSFIWQLIFIALAVLVLSLTTGIVLTMRQAKKKGEKFWNPGSRRLFSNLAIPLFTGGIFILILLSRKEYSMVVPACLIFYGLALVSGSTYTFSDVKWLGFFEIILGLFCALIPGYGIIFWVIGFGILHILYGSAMHFKYKQ